MSLWGRIRSVFGVTVPTLSEGSTRGALAQLVAETEIPRPGYAIMGPQAGFLDPNPELSPQDLYGLTPKNVGTFFAMRYTHAVICAAMNFRQRAMMSLSYGLEPARDTPQAAAAAIAVADAFERMPGWSLASWVSRTVDSVATYGFCLYELRSDDGVSIYPFPVAPNLIQQWIPDVTYTRLAGVLFFSGSQQVTAPASRFAWYGNAVQPGNFWGMSELRSLLSLYATSEQDIRLYLQQQLMARGFVYAKQTDDAAPVGEATIAQLLEWLSAIPKGSAAPIILPPGVELATITIQNPTIGAFGETQMRNNAQFREALMSSLGSLGISGDGARALGEEFRVADQQRFRAAVETYLAMLNGDTGPESSLLRALTENAGYPPECTPRVVTLDNTGMDAVANVSTLVQLAGSGFVTPPDLSADSKDRLIRGVGLEPASVDRPDDGDGDSDPDSAAEVETPLAVQTRARLMPREVQGRIFDTLLRAPTAGVTISPEWESRVRSWAQGRIPTDDDVRAAMAWLRSQEATESLAARAGSPEWYQAQFWGGRAGAAYWIAEAKRRGIA